MRARRNDIAGRKKWDLRDSTPAQEYMRSGMFMREYTTPLESPPYPLLNVYTGTSRGTPSLNGSQWPAPAEV